MSILLKPNSCRGCKHAEPLKNAMPGEPEFECKGAPPQVVAFITPSQSGPHLQVQTIFPRVNGDWTCGQFKPKIVTAPN